MNNLQSTEAKNKHETYLLLLRKLQLLQERHRNRKDHNIRRNIKRCIRKPKCRLIHAMYRDTCIPEVGYWNAHECRAGDCPAAVDDEDAQHNVAKLGDFRCCKNSFVLEDDGDFS